MKPSASRINTQTFSITIKILSIATAETLPTTSTVISFSARFISFLQLQTWCRNLCKSLKDKPHNFLFSQGNTERRHNSTFPAAIRYIRIMIILLKDQKIHYLSAGKHCANFCQDTLAFCLRVPEKSFPMAHASSKTVHALRATKFHHDTKPEIRLQKLEHFLEGLVLSFFSPNFLLSECQSLHIRVMLRPVVVHI